MLITSCATAKHFRNEALKRRKNHSCNTVRAISDTRCALAALVRKHRVLTDPVGVSAHLAGLAVVHCTKPQNYSSHRLLQVGKAGGRKCRSGSVPAKTLRLQLEWELVPLHLTERVSEQHPTNKWPSLSAEQLPAAKSDTGTDATPDQ